MRRALLMCVLCAPVLSFSQQDNSVLTKNNSILNIHLGSPSSLSITDKFSNQIQIRVAPSQQFADMEAAMRSCVASVDSTVEFLNQLEPVLSVGSWAREPLTSSRASLEATKTLIVPLLGP